MIKFYKDFTFWTYFLSNKIKIFGLGIFLSVISFDTTDLDFYYYFTFFNTDDFLNYTDDFLNDSDYFINDIDDFFNDFLS